MFYNLFFNYYYELKYNLHNKLILVISIIYDEKNEVNSFLYWSGDLDIVNFIMNK